MKFNFNLLTDGKGLWSHKVVKVLCTDIELAYVNEEKDFGELVVYFDKDTWDTSKDGLIYTDKSFLNDLRLALEVIGFSDKAVEFNPGKGMYYSEQGMQSDNYVSLDVGETFIREWYALSAKDKN